MSEENVELVQERYRQFIATGQVEPDWYDDAFVWDMSTFEGWPEKQEYHGVEGFREFFSEWLEAWDEWRMEADAFHALRDGRVLVLVRQYGKSKSTGLDVAMDFAQIWELREGRYVRMQMYAAQEDALEAAGLSV
jgi:ketosteroid isomerase-like protein